MFHVMPSYTDIMGASLVLGTVVTITFEKQISSIPYCCRNKVDPEMLDDTDASGKARKISDATFKARKISLSTAEKGGKSETEGLKGDNQKDYNTSNTYSHLSVDTDDENDSVFKRV